MHLVIFVCFLYILAPIINQINLIPMKKVLGIFAIVALFGATSCKKDYTCECTWTGGTGGIDIALENSKKSDATDACDAAETTYKNGYSDASCELK